MEQLVGATDAVVIGRTLVIEEGSTLEPDGSWFEGVRAIFAVERVLWARDPTESSIVLDGLAHADFPPLGVTAVALLQHDPEAQRGHRRLVAAGSLLISRNGVTILADRSPEFFQQFVGMPFDDAIDELTQVTSAAHQLPETEDAAVDASSIVVIASACVVLLGVGLALMHIRQRSGLRDKQ